MKKLIFLLFIPLFLFGQAKYFLPIPMISSGGRPILNQLVTLHPTGDAVTVSATLSWLDGGRYYWTGGASTVPAGSYDVYINGVLFAQYVGIYYGNDTAAIVSDSLRTSYNSQSARTVLNNQRIYNVLDYGAVGNGVTDDFTILDKVLDSALVNSAVAYIPSTATGIYGMDSIYTALGKSNFVIDGNFQTIKRLDNVHATAYKGILKFTDCHNFTIKNLVLDGNYAVIGGVENGGWNCGIILYGCTNVSIENVVVKNCATDGMIVCSVDGSPLSTAEYSKNIYVTNSRFVSNRRQGVSIINGWNVTFVACDFDSTSGLAPEAGVDIETDTDNYEPANANIAFYNCRFRDNDGYGIMATKEGDPEAITVIGCTFDGGFGAAYIEAPFRFAYNTIKNIDSSRTFNSVTTNWRGIIEVGSTYARDMRNVDISHNTFENCYLKYDSTLHAMITVRGIEGNDSSKYNVKIVDNQFNKVGRVFHNNSNGGTVFKDNQIFRSRSKTTIYSIGDSCLIQGNILRESGVMHIRGAYNKIVGNEININSYRPDVYGIIRSDKGGGSFSYATIKDNVIFQNPASSTIYGITVDAYGIIDTIIAITGNQVVGCKNGYEIYTANELVHLNRNNIIGVDFSNIIVEEGNANGKLYMRAGNDTIPLTSSAWVHFTTPVHDAWYADTNNDKNLTVGGDSVLISKSGMYEVNMSVTIKSLTANDSILVSIAVGNGSAPESNYGDASALLFKNHWTNISVCELIECVSGDIIKPYVQNTMNGNDIRFRDGNFIVKRIGN